MNTSIEIRFVSSPLSSAEAPAGYPNKNNRKRAGDNGKREKAGVSAILCIQDGAEFLASSLSPSPSLFPPVG